MLKELIEKIFGRTTKAKIVRSCIIITTVGTLVFGVMYGGTLYTKAQQSFKEHKENVILSKNSFNKFEKNLKKSSVLSASQILEEVSSKDLAIKPNDFEKKQVSAEITSGLIKNANIENNEDVLFYYNFKTGYEFPVSEESKHAVDAIVFGAKDCSTDISLMGGGVQYSVQKLLEKGAVELATGVTYSNLNTISGNVLAGYVIPSEKNVVKVYAGIDALHNFSTNDNAVQGKVGVSISFGPNSNNLPIKNNDDFGKFAREYDMRNLSTPNPQSNGNGGDGGSNPSPNKPTIIGPFDDGLGGNDLQQGR